MNPEQWKRAEALFERASKLPEGQWPGFLVSEASDDLELIDTVLKMLRSRGAAKFIEPPSGSSAPRTLPRGEAWIGRKLGDFELKEPIGHGGMGLVFKARQISLDRDVAVKILPFESLSRPDHVARFTKEARAAARLHHPNIVPIHAVGQEGDVRWFAMDLVDGPDLAREIKRLAGKESSAMARLPPFESREYLSVVVRLVEQAADALAYAHQNGIVHRDVKPHNLLVDPAGQVCVVDFGLARDEEQGTITSSSDQLGSPYYMSPEQVRHRMHAVDQRTDVYSLGVVLYELLTLTRPFDGATSAEVWYRIVHEEPRKLRALSPRVPSDLAVVCNKAMARELADRYASAEAFRDDLGRFLRHEAILARPPSIWRRARRFVARHPVACGSAATAVIAVAAGFWFADRRDRHRADVAKAEEIRHLLLAEPEWNARIDEVVAGRRLWRDLHPRAASLPDELRELEQRLDERFAADFEARRRRLEEHLALGLGGLRDPARWGGHASPSSPADLDLFQQESERMRAIYGDLPEAARLGDLSRTMPHVNLRLDPVTAADVAGRPALASMRAIDPLLGTRGERMELGELPLVGVAVPPGNWRLLVEIRGFGFAEYTRYLLPRAEPVDLQIRVRRSEAVQSGMKAIEAGRFTFDAKRRIGCDISGPTADFDAFLIDEAEVSNGEFVGFLHETGRPPPQRWSVLGFKGDWHELPIGDVGDRFLDLPVAGIEYGDAQAYSEWAGKRLPTHLELERTQRGGVARLFPAGEAELPTAAEKYNVYGKDAGTATTAETKFALYLASVKPVRDARYRQPPEELFHTFGNVSEMSESLLAEPEDDVLSTKIWQRVVLGSAWDAQYNQQSLQSHATFGVSNRYASMIVGLRCCKSRSP
jgi:serine/threonine protein kinase/formylglycine-generating enzyme required for sulfatase activity